MEYNFDEIRAYNADEIPAAMQRLTSEKAFMNVVSTLFPLIPKENLKERLLQFNHPDDLQKEMIYPFLQYLEANLTTGIELRGVENLEKGRNYLFISNHRDIILDSALLCGKLLENGFDTVEIAIGDNLLVLPWIEDLVRVNKSFIVQRGINPRKILESSQRLSAYMRHVIHEKKSSMWIAQREGRAKDSDDRTQLSLLKMLNLAGESKDIAENLKELNIVPLSISYEYDPCDYLKAKEFQQKRDNPEHTKSPQDDLINMQTGVMGYKGKVVFHIGNCINDKLDEIANETSIKNKQFQLIASHIDKQIHQNYNIRPNNYLALDTLEKTDYNSDKYSSEDKETFENYIDKQIRKIDLDNKDRDYLYNKILEMYANPLINHLSVEK